MSSKYKKNVGNGSTHPFFNLFIYLQEAGDLLHVDTREKKDFPNSTESKENISVDFSSPVKYFPFPFRVLDAHCCSVFPEKRSEEEEGKTASAPALHSVENAGNEGTSGEGKKCFERRWVQPGTKKRKYSPSPLCKLEPIGGGGTGKMGFYHTGRTRSPQFPTKKTLFGHARNRRKQLRSLKIALKGKLCKSEFRHFFRLDSFRNKFYASSRWQIC